MTIDATLKTILMALLLVISVPVMFYFWKLPKSDLSASEKKLITFSTTPLEMSPPKPQVVYSALESPVKVISKQNPPFAGSAVKNVPSGLIPVTRAVSTASRPALRNTFGSHPVVSMIYSEGSVKTAVINSQVLHEGSVFGSSRIITIEKNRVLMRSAGRDIWLSID
jgi:hypothetical protein